MSHFCGVPDHIGPNCYKLKHAVFQSRICDDISPLISHDKLFHLRLKNLSLLACESKLQDFNLFQKKCIIPHIHSIYHGCSPTKPKMRVVWVEKIFSGECCLLILDLILSIICGHVYFLFLVV